MNKFFLGLFKGVKNTAKYVIFSAIFVLACFIGVDNVEAAASTSIFDASGTGNIAKNDKNVGAGGLTPIQGQLTHGCVQSSKGTNYYGYTLLGSTETVVNTLRPCMSYTDTTGTYFYVQSNKDEINTITFTITLSRRYSYITIFEQDFSDSAEDSKIDYDFYSLNEDDDYVYRRYGTHADEPIHSNADQLGNNGTDVKTLTFVYQLRDESYNIKHLLSVYFYDGNPDDAVETKRAELEYILAKPIDDYSSTLHIDTDGDGLSCAVDDTNDQVCVLYTPKTFTADGNYKTNDFTVQVPDNAAIYFSTYNTHNPASGETLTPDTVQKYNSIYAINTFYNEGSTDPIQFYYHNVKDETIYGATAPELGLTAKSTGYKFVLTIDASGKYTFYIIDIFGNTLEIAHDDLFVDDVANRDLTIYFLSYKENDTTKDVDVYGKKAAAEDKKANFTAFELGDDLSVLTKDNLNMGLEFYYKVQIEGAYGVATGTMADKIKMNPLYYDSNETNKSKQIDMYDGSGTILSYYCRQLNVTDATVSCVPSDDKSQFNKRVLIGVDSEGATNKQEINATYTSVAGVSAITNEFIYKAGLVPLDQGIADTAGSRKPNLVNLAVNENGRFYVYIQDTLGNFTSSAIDVSIIDQLQPVITLNSQLTELANKICSSMYVIGAAHSTSLIHGSGNPTTNTYPVGELSDCTSAGSHALYNHFEPVDPTDSTLVLIERKGGNVDSGTVDTNGFYNTGSHSDKQFNYADAIRMALLRATDSISQYKYTVSGAALTEDDIAFLEKSIYEKTVNTYTGYKLYTVKTDSTKLDLASNDRVNFKNDYIITNNYLQYSSELKPYVGTEIIRFTVATLDAGGNDGEKVCESLELNATTGLWQANSKCYEIVNVYIDKSISFKMDFQAMDYAGNVSDTITAKIDVIDDTTPGIASIDDDSKLLTDPQISKNNMASECRLEIGSIIQTRAKLLECYGFLKEGKYKFVDNATTYEVLTDESHTGNKYYENVLKDQLYGQTGYNSADSSIKVYICTIAGKDKCSDAQWKLIESGTLGDEYMFANAGSYEIKFVISDTGKDYSAATPKGANTTTIILTYYVNPRVLLIRPVEKEKVYGQAADEIDYCVYATRNTDAFYQNLFNPETGTVYDYVLNNYESSLGIVYCTNTNNAGDGDSDAVGVKKYNESGVQGILATTENADASKKVDLVGNLSRTYATGTNRLNMGLGEKYEDAGYYYITLGDLKIQVGSDPNSAATQTARGNYIIRLHPTYLLDGQIPNTSLKNYYELRGDQYKYGVTGQDDSRGEVVSNVLYTIKQAELTIVANGGTKVYGNPDTNYTQAKIELASNNISQYTNVVGYGTDNAITTEGKTGSTRGYLNGFTISGLNETNTLNGYMSKISDFTNLSSVLKGYLRRQSGENVGRYAICNRNVDVIGNSITESCNDNPELITIANTDLIDLTTGASGNVYTLPDTSSRRTDANIAYGDYVYINSVFYKLTRNNTDLTNKKFTDFHNFKVWDNNDSANDGNKSLQVIANNNNGNKNYYITYTQATYTITPRELVVQPGANQGKEYSNPTHHDPIYELLVYGERLNVTVTDDDAFVTSTGGYTASISTANEVNPKPNSSSYPTVYEADNTTVKIQGDSTLYFDGRRTRTEDIVGASYLYKKEIPIEDGKFVLDGVEYSYSSNKICVISLGSDLCFDVTTTTEAVIGVNKVTISDDESKAIINWEGYLTYQTYELFTATKDDSNDIKGAGTGKIARTAGEVVGWYDYKFTSKDLRVVTNGRNQCTLNTTNYYYGVASGTDACGNYNVSYTKNAPAKNGTIYTTSTTAVDYLHDGENGSAYYDPNYPSGKTQEMLFFIFKREIILSFNALAKVYGETTGYFEAVPDGLTHTFFVGTNVTTVPESVTCYAKVKTSDKNAATDYEIGGSWYRPLTDSQCGDVDYGLSQGDTWGSDGLKLDFFIHKDIYDAFETNYALPAGMYYVYAKIGNEHGVHDNYKLTYVDYEALKGKDATTKNGALDITPRPIELIGTYYQKEYGQAIYQTYAANGTELSTTGNVLTGSYGAEFSTDKIINIFDNNYYYCNYDSLSTDAVYDFAKMGCAFETLASNNGLNNDANKDKYIYSSEGNVYLYTVVGATDASLSMIDSTAKRDDIYANFAGKPVRTRYAHPTGVSVTATDDKYGLLDAAGYYSIDLSGIHAVITNYASVTFKYDASDPSGSDSTGTIDRYTNYSIEATTSGRLYITPAEIQIEVVSGQKKMYGCAYNTFSTADSISYTYENGYNCVETVGEYYDMGYAYTVKKDKTNFLMSEANPGADPVYKTYTCDSDKLVNGDCEDVDYSSMADYTVEPSYGDTTDHDKPANTALNGGNLYRMPVDADADSISYGYKTYFENATKAQVDQTGRIFQNQNVGDYVITIGNLDAEFNKNNQCSANSIPGTGTNSCKNFIIKYAGYNTSGHTRASGSDQFSNADAEFTFTDLIKTGADDGKQANFKFTIFSRPVVVTTEYNYKVYGDTDPIEGFTCLDLKNMFTYTSGFGTAFSYTGRDYCNNDTDFISVGPARFYAIDNSLAKAPWTGWVDNAGSYDNYNDTLYDVFATTSKIERAGRGNDAAVDAGKDDIVGQYKLEYHLVLNSVNGANYKFNNNSLNVVKYLNYDADAASNKYSVSESLSADMTGFATVRGTNNWDRWYSDDNHECIIGATTNRACDAYEGTEQYNFKIKGISIKTDAANPPYTSNGSKLSTIQEGIYFEIVRREIYIFTGDTQKDYGIEDNYLMFDDNLKLCANDPFADDGSGNPVGCTPPAVPTTWGVRNSLSYADYNKFYDNGVFKPAAFMGTNDPAAYRGETTEANRAFGIYFYRQYGEQVGDYYIVACPTQVGNDLSCRTSYNTKYGSNSYTQPDSDDILSFQTDTFSSQYNASNYIVNTIPSKISVNIRKLNITPVAGQGFMYGNYESGDKIPPITFTEEYKFNNAYVNGLVNGGIYEGNDHVNNQYALCIYDMAEVVTCINNRQNSAGLSKSDDDFIGFVTTGLHNSGTSQTIAKASAGETYTNAEYLVDNVYNDKYDSDNDEERMALNRKINNEDGHRYNRNVGTYFITAGELTSSAAVCSGSNPKNCINKNYAIESFNLAADGTANADVEYIITAATITVTPRANQKKTYGQKDVEIKFDVVTIFTYDTDAEDSEHDSYYCGGTTCYDNNFAELGGTTAVRDTTAGTVTIKGFAYGENDTSEDGYNYGIAKENNKVTDASSDEELVDSDYDGSAIYPKFYDKYCAEQPTSSCTFNSGEETKYATLTYGSTNRILLGYFYLTGWNQSAGEHTILSGMVVSLNNVSQVNYIYNVSLDSANSSNVVFKIEKLNLDATIENVTKYYGQATDKYKCDTFEDCDKDYAVLDNANKNSNLNNEGRLEYNFNITDVDSLGSVHTNASGVVLLTNDNVSEKYYTQTGLAEYKNIHLGLSVVRKANNDTTCLVTTDQYGCEDAGDYDLVFRKQEVPQQVDANYNVTFGGADKTINASATPNDYAVVNNDTKSYSQVNGQASLSSEGNIGNYVIYNANNAVDVQASPTQISIVNDYSAKLTISKRHIMFYVGTYNPDGSPAHRFTIEQNEQVPEFPLLENDFTTSSTDPAKKERYYVTWFDQNEYVDRITVGLAQAPRKVRTGDELKGADAYGVVICKKSTAVSGVSVQATVFGSEACNADNSLSYGANGEGVNGFEIVDGGKQYNFDTSKIGDYPILRNKTYTHIMSKAHEEKNYEVIDHNGVLVIYEDQTAPVIQIGNNSFALEANADTAACDSGTIVNTPGQPFYYNGCDIGGLRFDENSKSLGDIIAYIANTYSGYNGAKNRFKPDATATGLVWTSAEKEQLKLPLSVAALANSSWIYQPVNNMGKTSANINTTLYSVDRSANTYAFNNIIDNNDANHDGIKDSEGVIDATDQNPALRAITTIISWFNINSYDYSYLRGDSFDESNSKRYTPRYYFYIEGNDTVATFDPTYVGTFKVYIYAMDDVGNVTLGTDYVELNIVDTTKPETGEAHIFNAPVVCDAADGNCKADSIDNWNVKEGYVHINAFRKYTSAGVEDNVNGTYIKLNGRGESNEGLIDLYGTSINRYLAVNDTTTNILGNYVKVVAGKTPAMEIEHRYWSNSSEKYLVVVGGKDNSYLDAAKDDNNSQWHTYYTIDGTTWYKYLRHDSDGVKLAIKDGTTLVVTKVLDNGRTFAATTFEEKTYYSNIYLQNGTACKTITGADIANCNVVGDTEDITQVNSADITFKENVDGKDVYTVNIQSIVVSLTIENIVDSKVSGKATWNGGPEEGKNISDNEFEFGIMICTITPTENTSGWKLNCMTEYNLVYKDGDKHDIDVPKYVITDTSDTKNLGDADTSTPNPFYKDRMYIFVDTKAPTFELNGQKYSVFEYETYCAPSVEDDICKNNYEETFVNATDEKGGGTSSVENNSLTAVTGTKLPTGVVASGTFPVAWYTLAKDNPDDATESEDNYSVLERSDSVSSGLLTNNSDIMGGASTLNSMSTFNQLRVNLSVYLSMQSYKEQSDGSMGVTRAWYRYLAVYNGEKYYVYRSKSSSEDSGADADYAVVANFSAATLNNSKTTIKDVLEYIVSTSSVDFTGSGITGSDAVLLTYSINYNIKDAAGNVSADVANSTIRGVTLTKLSATVAVAANVGAAMQYLGNNRYQVSMNQGMSLTTIFDNISVSNVDVSGNNHISSIRQSLFYNGVALYENIGYNSDILANIDNYLSAPGTYTLKLTSQREVVSGNKTFLVDDMPLELNFVVEAPRAITYDNNDYSRVIVTGFLLVFASICMVATGYVVSKRKQENN